MRIMSWNVNGFRAVRNKGFTEFLDQFTPDILLLQEVKARPEQVKEEDRTFPGFEMIWNPAERPGYSGVATLTRQVPDETRLGMGKDEFDSEGRMIWTRFGQLWICNSYFPNGQRGQDRVDFKLSYYEHLLSYALGLIKNGYDVIIGGDWNTAHTEIDLANPKENAQTSGFLPEEREWVSKFLHAGFRDIYREMNPDARDYTWWTYRFNARVRNIGWHIDYFLMNSGAANKVKESRIYPEVLGSDHCPVEIVLES